MGSNWWLSPAPLKNDGVRWDDDIPNIWEKHVPNHQAILDGSKPILIDILVGLPKPFLKNGFARYQALTHSHITIMFETAELSLTSNMSSSCQRGFVESPKFHGLEPHFSIQLPITNFQTHVGNHGKLIHLHI